MADVLAERELLAAPLGPDADKVLKASVLLSPSGFNARSSVTETHPLPNAFSNQPRQRGHVRGQGVSEAAGLVIDV